MSTTEVIMLARQHTSVPIKSSEQPQLLDAMLARNCLIDAMKLEAENKHGSAKRRALKSLRYSIGTLHPDYIRANQEPVAV